MKVVESNLELVEFVIVNSNYKFIDPREEIDIREVFSKYEIEIDFGKRDIETKDEEHVFNVVTKAVVNQTDNPQPGYQIFAEGISVFRIKNPKKIDDKILTNLKNISALSISINNIRNYITNMTAYGPFGKYIFPAVDVNQLLKEKIESQRQNKK
jgi:preprotein translocase subunit SecB